MGDSGAMLLGFVLATVSVQGLLKTAATVALVLPAARARRPDPRHRRSWSPSGSSTASRSRSADRTHLHHRFVNIGFSQRRAVVYL